MQQGAPDAPWRVSDVMSLGATLGIGLGALVVGWIGVSGEAVAARQTSWLNVGIGGLVISGIGTAVWLMTGRRAVGQRRRALLADVDLPDPATLPLADADAPVQPAELVVLPGMSRYHRRSCELVTGKQPKKLGTRRAGLVPCGVCQPLGEHQP